MASVLIKQVFSNGATLNNYVASDLGGAKVISELLTGSKEIYTRSAYKDDDVDYQTRLASIQLYDDSGNKHYLTGRVSKYETSETIASKLLPFTIGGVTYNKAHVSLSTLK